MHERALAAEPAERLEPSAHWMIAELHDVWSASQAEADGAYEHWQRNPGAEAYAVYRAAQDRADAAQEHLARWCDR